MSLLLALAGAPVEPPSAEQPITTSARFFGLPGPPPWAQKPREDEELPVVTVEHLRPYIGTYSASAALDVARATSEIAAHARASVARINRAIALRRTHDAALFAAGQKAALAQEIDRLIAEEIRRIEIEIDDEEVLLLAA